MALSKYGRVNWLAYVSIGVRAQGEGNEQRIDEIHAWSSSKQEKLYHNSRKRRGGRGTRRGEEPKGEVGESQQEEIWVG